jgi:hypothetical protein
MYAVSMRELGTGPIHHDTIPAFIHRQPARYRVRFRVPAHWTLPGIFAVKDGADGRYWPARPGEEAETWCGELELLAALWPRPFDCAACAAGRYGKQSAACETHGWRVEILERLLFTKAGNGPLGLWSQKLRELRATAQDVLSAHRACLAAAAIRAILLNTLGSFNQLHAQRRTRMATHGDDVPRGVDARPYALLGLGGQTRIVYRWSEPVPREGADEARAARWRHPEWCSQVWSGCRARLLLQKVGESYTGLLTLPPGSVVAIQTDALLLAHDPQWADDGYAGRLRCTRRLPPENPSDSAQFSERHRPESWEAVEALKAAMAPVQDRSDRP